MLKIDVMLFDLNDMPFSQGEAIKSAFAATGGTLESAGEIINGLGGQTGFVYLKQSYEHGDVKQVESVWKDTGTALVPLNRKKDDEPWMARSQDSKGVLWTIAVFQQVKFITLVEAQAMQRIDRDLDRGLNMVEKALRPDTDN